MRLSTSITMTLTFGLIGTVLLPARSLPPQERVETLRINGWVKADDGVPIDGARITTDALRGPGGNQFAGQRVFKTRTNKKGEWGLLGLTRGLWVFEVTAPNHFPHVVVVPIYMMLRPEPLPWETTLFLMPTSTLSASTGTAEAAVRYLTDAATAVNAGDKRAAREALSKLVELAVSPAGLCAAGDIALYLREPAMARRLFDAAAAADPKWYRPKLGSASASMMLLDFDRAIKGYAEAREASNNESLQRMLSSAVRELQQIRTIGRGH